MEEKVFEWERSLGQGLDTTYLPSYDECYVCGQHHPRGLRIRFFASPDRQVHARFQPDGTQTGYDNVVHGGVISALLDELTGWAVSLLNNRLAYTAELIVRFVKPMPLGRSYLATSRVASGRGRYWEADGSIADQDGQVYAKAHGKYFLLSDEQTAAMAAKMTYLSGDLSVFLDRERCHAS
jgi:uncharacterized protein (TIGR00369 family)